MTTKELIPVLQAFVEGKKVEAFDMYFDHIGWTQIINPNFTNWDLSRFSFRISPDEISN